MHKPVMGLVVPFALVPLKGVLASRPSDEVELRSQRVTEVPTHAGH